MNELHCQSSYCNLCELPVIIFELPNYSCILLVNVSRFSSLLWRAALAIERQASCDASCDASRDALCSVSQTWTSVASCHRFVLTSVRTASAATRASVIRATNWKATARRASVGRKIVPPITCHYTGLGRIAFLV